MKVVQEKQVAADVLFSGDRKQNRNRIDLPTPKIFSEVKTLLWDRP
jgi:hypothetical protein